VSIPIDVEAILEIKGDAYTALDPVVLESFTELHQGICELLWLSKQAGYDMSKIRTCLEEIAKQAKPEECRKKCL